MPKDFYLRICFCLQNDCLERIVNILFGTVGVSNQTPFSFWTQLHGLRGFQNKCEILYYYYRHLVHFCTPCAIHIDVCKIYCESSKERGFFTNIILVFECSRIVPRVHRVYSVKGVQYSTVQYSTVQYSTVQIYVNVWLC